MDDVSPTVTSYNATLYSIEELDEGDHHLVITLQDYKGNESDMMFDFAAVNGTRPFNLPSGSSEYVPFPLLSPYYCRRLHRPTNLIGIL